MTRPAETADFADSSTLEHACSTCGDVAVPVEVVARSGVTATVVDACGQRATVALDFVPDAKVGDTVLLHAGVAIARLEPSPEGNA